MGKPRLRRRWLVTFGGRVISRHWTRGGARRRAAWLEFSVELLAGRANLFLD